MSKKNVIKESKVTLSIPLLELDNNEPWSIENYSESGLFIVKSRDNIYHLAEVDMKGCGVNEYGMPASFFNRIAFNSEVIPIRDEMRSMITSLSEMIRGEFETSRKEMQSSVLELEKWMNEDKDSLIEKLETLVEELKHNKSEEAPKIVQGHISESALVEILRTIK